MAANHISNDKIVGQFFNRANRRADISGNIPSDHFVTSEGRKGRRTTDKIKIQDDIQFTGRAYQVSTADASCVRGSVSFGVGNGEEGTLSIWFKLNSMNDGVIFHGVYDYVKLAGSGTQIKIAGNTNSGGTPAIFDIPTIQINEWYHLVVFLDGINDEAKVWLNSIESTSGGQSIIPELSSLLRIGIYNGMSSINLDGYIAHVGRWSKELTQEEVERLYAFDIPTSQIDFYLPLEQASDEALVPSVVSSASSFTTENFISGDWVEDSEFPFSWLNEKGYNPYYEWNGSRFVRLNTGWELANDWKVTLREVYVYPNITSNITLFSLNGSYYTYIDIYTNGELQVGIVTSEGPTNIPIATTDLFDGKSHTIEVIKSSTGDGSGNGVKVIFDGVDLGWVQALADTTLDNVPQSTRTTIGHYHADTQQNHIGTLGDVEYYDINDNLIKKFTASTGYKDQSGTSPLSSSLPTLTSVPASISAPGKDIFDKDLEFKGKLAPRIQLVNAPCVSLNGIDQYIVSPTISFQPGNLLMSTNIYLNSYSGGGNSHFLSCHFDGSNFFTLGHDASGYLRLVRYNVNQISTLSTLQLQLNTWHSVSIERVSDTVIIFTLDGISEEITIASVPAILNTYRFYIGTFSGTSGYTDAMFCNTVMVNDNTTMVFYPLSERNNRTTYDLSGNSLHGSIVNAVLPDVWGTQSIYHNNFFNGADIIPSTKRFSAANNLSYNYGELGKRLDQMSNGFVMVFEWFTYQEHALGDFYNIVSLGSPWGGGATFYLANRTQVSNTLRLSLTDIDEGANYDLPLDGIGYHQLIVSWTGQDAQANGSDFFNRDRIYHVYDGETNFENTALDVSKLIYDPAFDLIIGEGGSHPGDMDFISFKLYERVVTSGALDNGPFPVDTTSYELVPHFDVDIRRGHMREAVYGVNPTITGEEEIVGSYELPHDLNDKSLFGKFENGLYPSQNFEIESNNNGYKQTSHWNGASDIKFPDIPEIPKDLRAKTFTSNEIDAMGTMGFRLAKNTHDLLVLSEPLNDLSLTRYLNLGDYEPETDSYKNFTGAQTFPDLVSDKNIFELDVFIKALKKGLNLKLGQRNLNSVFDYLFVFAIDLPSEQYQDTSSLYTNIPRYWAIDIANNREIRERADQPYVNFLKNRGINTTSGNDRLSVADYDLDQIANSSVVHHKNIEMGTFFIENTLGVSNDYIASGYNNSDAIGLYMGVQWQSANSGRIAARLNSSSLRYSDYFDPVKKLISCKRVGDTYYYFVDGELVNTHTSISEGAIPSEQYFAFMSSAWSGGGFANASCRNPIAINYMANAERLNTKVLSECFKDYYNRRNLSS